MPKFGEAQGVVDSDPLAESLRESVTEKLKEWVETHPAPDTAIVAAAGTEEALSPRQILREVQSRTTVGEEIVKNWVSLLIKTIREVPL